MRRVFQEEEMRQIITGVRCPRCGGNLYLDRDHMGWYEQCLQCAYMKDLAVVYQNKKKAQSQTAPPRPVVKQDSDTQEDIVVGN